MVLYNRISAFPPANTFVSDVCMYMECRRQRFVQFSNFPLNVARKQSPNAPFQSIILIFLCVFLKKFHNPFRAANLYSVIVVIVNLQLFILVASKYICCYPWLYDVKVFRVSKTIELCRLQKCGFQQLYKSNESIAF